MSNRVMRCLSILLLTTVLLVARFVCVRGGQSHSCTPDDTTPHKQGVCGDNISSMLKVICGPGGYAEQKYVKRSLGIGFGDLPASALLEYIGAKSESSPSSKLSKFMLDKKQAKTFLHKRMDFYLKGISCECCYHGCSIEEFAQYCKDGKKAMENLRAMIL